MQNKLNIGIVSTGMISKVIADAIIKSKNGHISGAASRKLEDAQRFLKQLNVDGTAFSSWQDMVHSSQIDAIYIGTPTQVKEEIAVHALTHSKHVLVDKPFASSASTKRMIDAARKSNAVLMDATHFVHHPRTGAIKNALASIGNVTAIRSAFYFPFDDRNNIRFNPKAEPSGALGDLAWYNMRAVVEFLNPTEAPTLSAALLQKDKETGAIVKGAGLLAFNTGATATWDIGYTSGTIAMDLDIIGTLGIISLDDFNLDWTNSFAFQNPNIETTYQYRTGLSPRLASKRVSVPSQSPAHVLMIDAFVDTIRPPMSGKRLQYIEALERTQDLLDLIHSNATVTEY